MTNYAAFETLIFTERQNDYIPLLVYLIATFKKEYTAISFVLQNWVWNIDDFFQWDF